MFGPQARAAELQAVRSAAMRQKTHDGEEQIPTPAAVSLTEFARAQAVSRNKGTKQYKPLNLEDLDNRLDDLAAEMVTSSGNLEPEIARSISAGPGYQTPQLRRFAPSAPKAMLETSSMPSSIRTPMQTPQAQLHSSDNNVHVLGWLPTPTPAKTTFPASFYSGSCLPPKRPLTSANFFFGLNGYSPAKPELQYESMLDARPQNATTGVPSIMQTDNGYLKMLQAHTYHNLAIPFHCAETANHQGNLRQFNAEPFGYDDPYLQPRFERSSTFANDILHHENRLQAVKRESSHFSDSPYDRSTKMQSFVAAQQAMAKTGKTVLHNPQLFISAPEPRNVPTLGDSSGHPPISTRIPRRESSDKELRGSNVRTESARRLPSRVTPVSPTHLSIESGSLHDPFSSGFTPQARPIDLFKHNLSSGKCSSPNAPLKIEHRRPEECPAIWNAMKERDAKNAAQIQCLSAYDLHDPASVGGYLANDFIGSNDVHTFDQDIGTEGWCRLHQLGARDVEKIKDIFMTVAEISTCKFNAYELNKHPPITQSNALTWLQHSVVTGTEHDVTVGKLIDEHKAKGMMGTTATATDCSTSLEANNEFKSDIAKGLTEICTALTADDIVDRFNREHQTADFARPDLDDVATPGPAKFATRMLRFEGQALVSPPARLARDPRYRPLSVQTGGLHESLRRW